VPAFPFLPGARADDEMGSAAQLQHGKRLAASDRAQAHGFEPGAGGGDIARLEEDVADRYGWPSIRLGHGSDIGLRRLPGKPSRSVGFGL
jgi:hypothetical protein